MPNVPEDTQEKIRQLQMLEQALQQLMMQKQAFQLQLMEAETALKELGTSEEAYKILGNIMVLAKKEEVENELKDKKETTELRISALEKQEAKTREKAAALQKEVIETMRK
ncbi:TPA: prefoldin subunit beta [Candidatus Woesearchaeota archaeon]|nr:prefoldin subunit beta [Candidatus Woesearchaeota archaeon]